MDSYIVQTTNHTAGLWTTKKKTTKQPTLTLSGRDPENGSSRPWQPRSPSQQSTGCVSCNTLSEAGTPSLWWTHISYWYSWICASDHGPYTSEHPWWRISPGWNIEKVQKGPGSHSDLERHILPAGLKSALILCFYCKTQVMKSDLYITVFVNL